MFAIKMLKLPLTGKQSFPIDDHQGHCHSVRVRRHGNNHLITVSRPAGPGYVQNLIQGLYFNYREVAKAGVYYQVTLQPLCQRQLIIDFTVTLISSLTLSDRTTHTTDLRVRCSVYVMSYADAVYSVESFSYFCCSSVHTSFNNRDGVPSLKTIASLRG